MIVHNTLAPSYFDDWISAFISEVLYQKHLYLKDKRWRFLFSFFFLGICAFGCCRIWPLPPQHRQTLPSFTLSLIVGFKGSGETNSICFKALLARLCLLKLWFVTDSTLLGEPSLGPLLSYKCGTAGPQLPGRHCLHHHDHGKGERSLQKHSRGGLSASLKGRVTPSQEKGQLQLSSSLVTLQAYYKKTPTVTFQWAQVQLFLGCLQTHTVDLTQISGLELGLAKCVRAQGVGSQNWKGVGG